MHFKEVQLCLESFSNLHNSTMPHILYSFARLRVCVCFYARYEFSRLIAMFRISSKIMQKKKQMVV